MVKKYIEDQASTKMDKLDTQDSKDKNISVEKLKAQRAKHLEKQK